VQQKFISLSEIRAEWKKLSERTGRTDK